MTTPVVDGTTWDVDAVCLSHNSSTSPSMTTPVVDGTTWDVDAVCLS